MIGHSFTLLLQRFMFVSLTGVSQQAFHLCHAWLLSKRSGPLDFIARASAACTSFCGGACLASMCITCWGKY